jgi:hypothetical protein
MKTYFLEQNMKKLFFLLILMAAAQSFAIYVDAGLGIGDASSSVNGNSYEDHCPKCSDLAVTLNVRVGEKILPNLWVAGELSGVGNRYGADLVDGYGRKEEFYTQFNSYYLGPSVIFYPIDHLHLSASLGFSWTANSSNFLSETYQDGKGVAFALSVAYDTGKSNGALLGMKFYTSHVSMSPSQKSLSTTGLLFFVNFVHK